MCERDIQTDRYRQTDKRQTDKAGRQIGRERGKKDRIDEGRERKKEMESER